MGGGLNPVADRGAAIVVAIELVLMAVCLAAAYYDLRGGRIPNRLTYPSIAMGLVLTTMSPGTLVTEHLLAVVLGFACLFPFWQSSLIGGGDVKLTMAVGAFKGSVFVLHFLMYAFSFCIVAIVFVSVYQVGLLRLVSYTGRTMLGLFVYRFRPLPMKELEGRKIPFAAVAAVAVAICLYLDRAGLLVSPLG